MKRTEQVERYQVTNDGVSEQFKHTSAEDREALKTPFNERLLEGASMKIISSTPEELVFSLMGVDASIANALRRIMLAEVPTVAIEYVYIQMNSSIIHDEVLAHRLGLVPINVDPRLFKDREEGEEANSENTIVFDLNVECVRPEGEEMRSTGVPYTMPVYSSSLKWVPQGDQAERFPAGIRPVHEDILLAKLRPGQSIKLEAHCQKGVGKEHAKFSPVATASYRLMPDISFKQPLKNELADELKDMCPMDVFDIEDLGADGRQATVARPMNCSMCRECIRLEGWVDRVALNRVADHYIFKVEAVGMLSPREIVKESIRVLKEKGTAFLSVLDEKAEEADGPEEGTVDGQDIEGMLQVTKQ